MEKTIKEIFLNHEGKVSDKWRLYINEWDNIFSPFRKNEINLLEIGVQNGGSLEIWGRYFSKAKNIIGVDINEKCKQLDFIDPRITLIVGDINTEKVEHKIIEVSPEFDIILDDGSHTSSDTIHSFIQYFNYLNKNGIYVIEDLHTSYWHKYEGGLNNPYSTISFLKNLLDVINFEHWRNGKSRNSHLSQFEQQYDVDLNKVDLCEIHSIYFLNSLCIIKKQSPDKNILGKRTIVGNNGIITKDWQEVNGTSIHDIAVSVIDDSHMNVFSLIEETKNQKQQLELDKEVIQDLEQELETYKKINEEMIQDLEQEVLYYALSKSWRLTRPLRKIMKFIKNALN